MPGSIIDSVGVNSRNLRNDVIVVQRLLTENGVSPGMIDGQCGARTINAILHYQSRFLLHPDGRVDPRGSTMRHLNNGSVSGRPASTAAAAHVVPILPRSAALAQVQPSAALTTLLPRPARNSINCGLVAVDNRYMLQTLGRPREDFTHNYQTMTNPTLKKHLITTSVGPFRVTGLRSAVESLGAALAQVHLEQPAVYAALGTQGMLNCRLQVGSATAISNHSWGTAVDVTLNGQLDTRGNNKVQVGLTLMAPIMNQHGWYWGAGFATEDGMHFEASKALITAWAPNLR